MLLPLFIICAIIIIAITYLLNFPVQYDHNYITFKPLEEIPTGEHGSFDPHRECLDPASFSILALSSSRHTTDTSSLQYPTNYVEDEDLPTGEHSYFNRSDEERELYNHVQFSGQRLSPPGRSSEITPHHSTPDDAERDIPIRGHQREISGHVRFSRLQLSSPIHSIEITSPDDVEEEISPLVFQQSQLEDYPWLSSTAELPLLASTSTATNYEPVDPEYANNIQRMVDCLHESNEYLEAAETGDIEKLKLLLKIEELDKQQLDFQGRNALHLAILSESTEAVELLLKAGVDPNVKDHLSMSPLSICTTMHPSIVVAQMLFDYGAKVMPRERPCDAGLFLQYVIRCTPECTQEEIEILHLLVKKGAVINDPKAPGGRQALHLAVMNNNLRLIKALFEMGADLTLRNHRGETPKECAVTFKCWAAYHCLHELEAAMMGEAGSRSS